MKEVLQTLMRPRVLIFSIVWFFLVFGLLSQASHALTLIAGVHTTVPINCVNATTRTDGSPLAESDIERVEIDVVRGGEVHTVPMPGGCQTVIFDVTQLQQFGEWEMVGRTYDIHGLESINSPPTPFEYVLIAPPGHPTIVLPETP